MYKIVKSAAVELAEAVYVIPEFTRGTAARKPKPAAPPGQQEENAETPDAQEEQEVQEMPPAQEYVLGGESYAAEIKQMAAQQAEAILRDSAQRAQTEYLATMNRAQEDAQTLREQAGHEGRAEGMRSQIDHVRQAIAQLEQAVARAEAAQASYLVEYEQKLKWLALEIASKVLSKKVAENDTEMIELVRNAVSAAGNAKWISVEVCDEVKTVLEHLQFDLRADQQLELHGVSAPPGTCRVETSDGVIDASLYTQIENLREYFASEQPE